MAFPGTYNINYYRGDTFTMVLYPKDNTGSPFDLGAPGDPEADRYLAWLNIASARGSSGTKLAGTPVQLNVDYTNDSIELTISSSLGSTMVAGAPYVYDIEIIKNNTLVYTLLTGTITVTDDVKKV